MIYPLNMTPDRVTWHDRYPDWEAERLASMHDLLEPGDLIVDVGAECGDFPALWASWGCVVMPVEPNPAYWPAIRWHLEHNGKGQPPYRYFVGFAGDHDSDPEWVWDRLWPECSDGPISPDDGFRHVALDDCPTITLDLLCNGLPIDALTLDCEGSDLRALRGAQRILRNDHPKVWVSVHTDEAWMAQHYPGEGYDAIEAFMAAMGYAPGVTLADTHERHVLWL